MEDKGYTIRCGNHTYITLEYNGKFIFCLDNDVMYAEEMIYNIEKRTGTDFKDIQIKVDILLKVWPQKIRKGIKWLSLIIFFVYCVVVGYYSATWVIDVAKVGTSSIALGVPMVYFQCIIPIAHFLMAIRLIQVGLRYRKHPELLEEKSEEEEFAEFMSVAKGGADE